ncbi:MAG TPA: (Fe-S)-binding protein [Syntrophomonadaceae bacterium]|nr:(Fe-S)-binding protein [Syntrophomonadaceae bacterium]HPR94192.1 (Fe-S)-binding protein [Syntrophomonadaceae bacterium]
MNHMDLKPGDLGKPAEQLVNLHDLMPLSFPYNKMGMEPDFPEVKPEWRKKYCTSLDGCVAIDTLTRPQNEREETEFIRKFLNGLEKIFSAANSGVLQPLQLSFEYCAKCNTCSDACHVFKASGENEIYRPIFRSEVLRKIYYQHFTAGGKIKKKFIGADIDINWETIARLGELSYRCNLCRRCAQTCPLGLDNSLFAKEIRKIFSQEMGIAPTALHEKGTMRQLKTGSSTGIGKAAFLDMVEFLEEDIEDRIGRKVMIPIDKQGADILLIHNAGEFVAWPENPAAFAILFEEAGVDWTLSSETMGYDSVNYGIWYDDAQAKKVAWQQMQAARELGVRRIVIGECGHAHKASGVVADRYTYGEDKIPVESWLPIMLELIKTKRLRFDPGKNDFPVTLHDPCNMVRQMGIVKPQREILQAIAPGFREMTPHGVDNYCCGGGSGFAIMSSPNFGQFRDKVSARMKFDQILRAFSDTIIDDTIPKYVCAPCSNCKGSIREILSYYQATEKFNVRYGGLAELMVNALVSIDKPYLEFL